MFNALRQQHKQFSRWMHPTWTRALRSINDKTKCYTTSLYNSLSTRDYSKGDVTWLWEVNDSVRGFNEAAKHGTRLPALEYTYNSVRPLEPEHFEKTFAYLMRDYSTDDVTWLWEVKDFVRGFNEAAKQGTRVAALEYTYNSVKPLEPEHFEKTFAYFLRKFPNMKTVIRSKEGQSWYCQLQNYNVDFKVMSNEHTFRKECLELLDKGFQETDSLPWRARVVPRSPDTPCMMEEVKKTHPYQYDFIIMANHAVSDGIDAFMLSSCLLYGLNCAVGGIDFDNREYGTFENNREFEMMTNQKKNELLEDSSKFDAVRRSLPMIDHVPDTVKAFPRPNTSRPNSRYLCRNIDPEVMKGLLSKCKQMGVTFGSFAVSTCNLAMVEFMREAGLVRDAYELNTLLFMNSRRYRSKKSHLQGCYITALTYKSQASTDTKASFWDYCKKVNYDLQSHYSKGFVLDQTAMQGILDAEHKAFNYTDNVRPVCHDYTSNYLADVTKLYSSDNYKYVKLTDITSWQKIHKFRNALMQEIYTLNGITKNNITYADDYFSEDAVDLIANKISEIYEIVGK